MHAYIHSWAAAGLQVPAPPGPSSCRQGPAEGGSATGLGSKRSSREHLLISPRPLILCWRQSEEPGHSELTPSTAVVRNCSHAQPKGMNVTVRVWFGSVCGFETAVPTHAVRFLLRVLRFSSRFLAFLNKFSLPTYITSSKSLLWQLCYWRAAPVS